MKKINKIIYLCSVLMIYSTTPLLAQLILKDDFQTKNQYWYWRADGNQNEPTVHDGLLHLKLLNAVDSEYCNTEIYDPTKPYAPGTQARIRLKATPIHHGSRGWGFWDGSLSSVPTDFDVAWVMQQGSANSGENYNWFNFGSNSNNLLDWQKFNLDNKIDETVWQTYKIVWEPNKILFYVEDNLLFETSEFVPNQNMRIDIWIDNRVINLDQPSDFFNNNAESSEMFVDFVEISGSDGPRIEREVGGNVLLWDSPNSFPNGKKNHLWKQYEFDSENDSEALLFITGSAEKYTNSEGSDDLKVIVDNFDYGWRNSNSLDGELLNGGGKSIVLPIQLIEGPHKIDLYTETTPFLKDVIILSNQNSEPILIRDFNEAAEDKNGLWKTIDFNISGPNETTLIISGTADQNQALRIALDNKNYGWSGEQSINGNELNGTPKTVVINEFLEDGPHQLKIFNDGPVKLYSVAIYGSSKLTDVKDISNTELDNKNIIIKANPNPFNNSTIIKYITKQNSNNRVRIFNTLGQQIEILVDEFQNAGEHKLSWNPKNQTSGIYICILESDNYFKVEKLLLLK